MEDSMETITPEQSASFQKDYEERKRAGEVYRQYLMENSFYFRNQGWTFFIFTFLVPILLAIIAENWRHLLLGVAYLLAHIIITGEIQATVREWFWIDHPDEANILFDED